MIRLLKTEGNLNVNKSQRVMKSKMKKIRKGFRRLHLLSAVIALSLLIIVSFSYNMSAYALKKYGYEKGDEYQFVMEISTTTTTEEGTASTSQSNEFIVKIKDVDEDADGYSIKIKTLIVGSTGFYPGYGGLMEEQIIEGDRLMAYEGIGGFTGGYFNLFTSTDWDERGDEWEELIDEMDDQEGYDVREDSASNGVFSLLADIDVDDDESTMDYDDDDDYDGYTGRLSLKGEYDEKGVLKSSIAEYYMEFNERNNIEYSYKVYSGAPSLLPSESFIYLVAVVASFVVAFVIGFLVGKGRKPRAVSVSETSPTPSTTRT